MKKTTVALGNGIRLACLERPGGEVPLVLLHGITDNALTWVPVLDGIDPRCRVLAPDFRGHGASDKPEAFYDAEAYADDWFEVMANAPDPYTGKPGIETMGEEKIRLRLDSIGMMLPKALEDALAGSLEWGTDQVLGGLTCPVTMITGDPALGAVMTPEEAAQVAGIIPHAGSIQVNGVGHLIHDQQPDAWLEGVNGWIEVVLGPA